MDFHEILKLAHDKQGIAEKEKLFKKGIDTSLCKPKRDVKNRPKGVQSAAVQAFLKRKEEEEKRKAQENEKRKQKLMKLREEKNTVGKMRNIIKRNRTKEAIFEVEGKEENKSLDTPTMSSDKHEGEVTEYTKLKSQVGGKERKAAVKNIQRVAVSANWVPKEEREGTVETKPVKSSKNSKSSSIETTKSCSKTPDVKDSKNSVSNNHVEEKEKKVEKKKKKPPLPPPINFNDLLKLAEQKQKGVSIPEEEKSKKEKPAGEKRRPPMKLPDKPMTQEEKDRWIRVHSKEYQDWVKHGKARPEFCVKASKKRKLQSNAPKSVAIVSEDDSDDDHSSRGASICDTQNRMSSKPAKSDGVVSQEKPAVATSNGSRKNGAQTKLLKLKPSQDLVVAGRQGSKSGKDKISSGNNESSKHTPPSVKKKGNTKAPVETYDEVNENVLVCRPTEPQQSTWDRIYEEMHKKNTHGGKKRHISEESSEEDSEVEDFIDEDDDDFIDDSEAVDVSRAIKSIFGYDKNKYRDEDDDLSDMVSGFADVEREERISHKLGLKEDLEDIKREEEHKKRKMAMKRKKLQKH